MLKRFVAGSAIAAAVLGGLAVAAPAAGAAEVVPVAVSVPMQPPPGLPPPGLPPPGLPPPGLPPPGLPQPPPPGPLTPIVTPSGLVVVVLPTAFPTFDACASGAQAAVNAAGFAGFSWFCNFGLPPFQVAVIIGYI